MKVARASEVWAQLQGRIELWTTSQAVYLEILQTGPRTLEWIVRKQAGPPVEEWSLMFGDVVHNLRSSLDALTYDLCLLADPAPTASEQRQIYFPVEHSKAKWESRWIRDLRFLTAEVLDRIREQQPFNLSDPNDNYLHHIHAIDIADKHRGQVYVLLSQASLVGESVKLVLAGKFPEGAKVTHRTPEVPLDVIDGTVIAVSTFPTEIVNTIPLVVDRAPVRVWFDRDGTPVELGEYVPELIRDTKRLLSQVRQGSDPTKPGSIVMD